MTQFGSSKTRGLLIYLALHNERPLSREVLAALFWPEEADGRARANLRQSLHQLRKLLGDHDNPDRPFLLVTRSDIQLNPQGDTVVDVCRFQAAIDAHDLETAVDLYRGDLLPGFSTGSPAFEDWLRQERESLHHLALAAMHEHAQDLLESGSLDQAQAIARRQIQLEPWRETAFCQLMRAFALGGDRSSALAQYQLCCKALQDELGIKPAPETTALYEEILTGRVGPRGSERDIRPPREKRHNLPAETTPLVGREDELERIQALFSHKGERLVTIVGPGGMGKTRLALAAGSALLDSYRDGVYFVDLAPIEHAAEIPTAIASALNFRPPDRSQDIYPQLLAMLEQRRLLLILDNFEHLPQGIHFVTDILQACADVSILVTSRQRLNLAAESRFELGGLAYHEAHGESPPLQEARSFTAVQLFVDSGRRVRSDFALDENNLADVLGICRQLQGMPLALLLAAAWLELLSPAEIAVEIETGLDFLAADLSDLPPRQRSMEAVFGRSWALMSAQEQAVLARLSIFRRGFTRQAAEQVAGANLRILLALVDKSLVQRNPESGRFLIHELLRQFVAARRDRDEQIDLRHCRHYAQIAQVEVRRALGFYPYHLPGKLPHERHNFLRAWDYALQHGLALEMKALSLALTSYGFRLGTRANKTEGAIESLRHFGFADDSPVLLFFRLEAIDYQGHKRAVIEELLALLEEIEENGDPELRFRAHTFLAKEYGYDSDEALAWSARALASALASGSDLMIKQAQAIALQFKIRFDVQEESTLEALLELLAFFETDYPESEVVYYILLALSAYALSNDDFENALKYGRRALNVAIGWRDLGRISSTETNLAAIRQTMGRTDLAASHMLDCLAWHLAIGERWQTLGFLYAVPCNLPQLVIDNNTAVAIISFVYHHPESPPAFRSAISAARPDFEEEMGHASFSQAWDEGQALDFDTAVALLEETLAQVGGKQLAVTRD